MNRWIDDLGDERIVRLRLADIFAQYQACQHELTEKQWLCVWLRYHDGESQVAIARRLGKSATSISELLRRAKTRKDAYERKLRHERLQEQIGLLRENEEEA